jgi:hypothetical protein
MALRDLLAAGALQRAISAVFSGQIAPNIIRVIAREFPGNLYRSVRALVSRAFQSVRTIRESQLSSRIFVKDVPTTDMPAGAPFRGTGRGRFEARYRYNIPNADGSRGQWKTGFHNWDGTLTMQQLLDRIHLSIEIQQPFGGLGPRDVSARQIAEAIVNIESITRRF